MTFSRKPHLVDPGLYYLQVILTQGYPAKGIPATPVDKEIRPGASPVG